jgi:hypothetical protein
VLANAVLFSIFALTHPGLDERITARIMREGRIIIMHIDVNSIHQSQNRFQPQTFLNALLSFSLCTRKENLGHLNIDSYPRMSWYTAVN